MIHLGLIIIPWQGKFKDSSSRNLTEATRASMGLGTLNAINQVNAIF